MRFILTVIVMVVILFTGAWALGLVKIEQTRLAEAPEVKVEGGQMPAFEMKTAKIEVGTSNTTVEVPRVVNEKRTITTPRIEVKKAE